jgi:hypothetical protein
MADRLAGELERQFQRSRYRAAEHGVLQLSASVLAWRTRGTESAGKGPVPCRVVRAGRGWPELRQPADTQSRSDAGHETEPDAPTGGRGRGRPVGGVSSDVDGLEVGRVRRPGERWMRRGRGRAPRFPRFRRAAAACVRAPCHGWATAVLPEAVAPARAAVPPVLHLASATSLVVNVRYLGRRRAAPQGLERARFTKLAGRCPRATPPGRGRRGCPLSAVPVSLHQRQRFFLPRGPISRSPVLEPRHFLLDSYRRAWNPGADNHSSP